MYIYLYIYVKCAYSYKSLPICAVLTKHKGRAEVQQLRMPIQFSSKLLQCDMAVAPLSDEGLEWVAAEPRRGEYPADSQTNHGVMQLGSAGKGSPHPILVSLLTCVPWVPWGLWSFPGWTVIFPLNLVEELQFIPFSSIWPDSAYFLLPAWQSILFHNYIYVRITN